MTRVIESVERKRSHCAYFNSNNSCHSFGKLVDRQERSISNSVLKSPHDNEFRGQVRDPSHFA